jgi:hypothetical protein
MARSPNAATATLAEARTGQGKPFGLKAEAMINIKDIHLTTLVAWQDAKPFMDASLNGTSALVRSCRGGNLTRQRSGKR